MPHRPNGKYVSNSDALAAWTPIAREELLETARRYAATMGANALADVVQRETGILADQPIDTWMDKLLDRVAVEAEKRGEPPLASLCPRAADSADDAAARLACYRAYADDLPEDGGSLGPIFRHTAPRREPRARTSTRTTPRAPENQMREVTCTSCWMIVPARDTCTSCGAALSA